MQRYLVLYGADNEMVTYEAENPTDVVTEFGNHFEGKINEICLCLPIIGWEDAAQQTIYATGADGSWFGAADLDLVMVPSTITDADEIEDFIVNHRGQN